MAVVTLQERKLETHAAAGKQGAALLRARRLVRPAILKQESPDDREVAQPDRYVEVVVRARHGSGVKIDRPPAEKPVLHLCDIKAPGHFVESVELGAVRHNPIVGGLSACVERRAHCHPITGKRRRLPSAVRLCCMVRVTSRYPSTGSGFGPRRSRRSIGSSALIVILDGSGMRPGRSSTVTPKGGPITSG